MHMPSGTTLDGKKKDGHITIHWNKSMWFNGRSADFDGGVVAFQDNGKLQCQQMQATFDRPLFVRYHASDAEHAYVVTQPGRVFVLPRDGSRSERSVFLDLSKKVFLDNWEEGLLGFAFDGYPIYGAYGYANADGTGGIVRIRSGYQLRSITTRTTHADGTDVSDGPAVSQTYPLGYFREDYEFVQHAEPYYLDAHNGRFCVTPEYPGGTYAYFCTVDEHWNSAYPYVVGPTFYGVKNVTLVTNITEDVTTYDPTTAVVAPSATEDDQVTVFPNPGGELIAVQVHGLVRGNLPIALYDMSGKLVRSDVIKQGSTIWYLDTRTLYDGLYAVRIGQDAAAKSVPVQVVH